MVHVTARRVALISFLVIGGLSPSVAAAQTEPPAKKFFGGMAEPSPQAPQVFGGYAMGCLAGAVALAPSGPGWQAMRPSRNRNFGHPSMIAFVERLSAAAQTAGWPGVLVGDIAQPRGGPMLTGHRSHQTGIDADIWMLPAPARELSRQEREELSSINVVAPDRKSLSAAWTASHFDVIRAAAEDLGVARIFVNAAIKQGLCEQASARGLVSDEARGWLRKVRPWWGHKHHFHVRLHCPPGSPGCQAQDPPPPGDGCDATLAWWFSDEALNPKPKPKPAKPRKAITLADLPTACRALVAQ